MQSRVRWRRVGLLLEALLLANDEGADIPEGGQRPLTGENGDQVAQITVQAAQCGVDEVGVGDGLVAVPQSVSEHLEACTVLRDRHVSLPQRMELGVEVNSKRDLVVEEEIFDLAPDGCSRITGGDDDGEDLGADRRVEPRDYGEVILDPLRVAAVHGRRKLDVILDVELPKDREEDEAPEVVVRHL